MPRTKKHRGNEITIDGADFFFEKTQDEHHTDEFESDHHLVVRRGADLNFQVQFSRPLSGDEFEVELHRGFRTSFRRGTRFVAELGRKPELEHQLELKKLKSDGAKVTFALSFPANMPVGAYRLELEVSPEHSRVKDTFKLPWELVILFNPWCPKDSVYMKDDAHRQEYIMNETGLIWAGTYDNMFTWPWNFAQFETTTLEAVLYMLDLYAGIDSDGRRSPIEVARALTEMVNKNDGDCGILFGLWSGNDEDYKDGTDPTAWSGSSAILEEYMRTKMPVKYAQCWVFGGTLTTVLRAIGIPARPITNFESAHDADSNRALDYFYDAEGNFLEGKSGDSVWNYHVWAEAWMSRTDLGPSYGGWQAVDSTPQELSPETRTMVVGPASVAAIKDGQDKKYDNEFVISEVNADVKYYYETKGGKFVCTDSDTTYVGRSISTKAVGTKKCEDITKNYKYKEGTLAERATLGAKESTKPKDVRFGVSFSRKAEIGEDFDVVVTAHSSTKEKRTISVRVCVYTISYTGVASKVVKASKHQLEIKNGGSSQCSVSVSSRNYLDALGDQALLSVTVLALVEESEQSWVGKVPYRLKIPDLTMMINGKKASDAPMDQQGGQSCSVTASFTNPLKKTLTNVVFYIEGARLTPTTKMEGKSTPPSQLASVSFNISPRKPRKKPQEHTLVVTCQSKELKGVMGTAVIRVT